MTWPKIPPPNTADKFHRALWRLVWVLLYRPSPTQFHAWRRFLLRCFGARVGAGAHPYPSARIWAPWNLVMEARACLANESDCYNVAKVILEADVVVSQKAYLCTVSHDIEQPGFALTGAPIILRRHAWVAASAFVGPGITMGAGSVAGACAVVTRDVEAGVVVAGNPARAIGASALAADRDGLTA